MNLQMSDRTRADIIRDANKNSIVGRNRFAREIERMAWAAINAPEETLRECVRAIAEKAKAEQGDF